MTFWRDILRRFGISSSLINLALAVDHYADEIEDKQPRSINQEAAAEYRRAAADLRRTAQRIRNRANRVGF